MRKGIFLIFAGFVLCAGCGNQSSKPSKPPDTAPKKAPYHIEFETKAPPPNPAGVTLPNISYTANPKALERRAALVVKFDATGAKNYQAGKDRVIMGPVDVPGTGGTLPASYMELADAKLAKLLAGYCMKGPVKVVVTLVRSSIKPEASDAEINAKRLSDWLGTEVTFKNPHPKC